MSDHTFQFLNIILLLIPIPLLNVLHRLDLPNHLAFQQKSLYLSLKYFQYLFLENQSFRMQKNFNLKNQNQKV